MCGRYVPPDESAIERLWQVDRRNWPGWIRQPFNTAPTHEVPVILRASDGAYELDGARWGLIPTWWKKETLPSLSFNARSEEAAEKPMWRTSLKAQRCLMPAVGWFEWCETEPTKNEKGRKCFQPYYLHAENNEAFAIAGLWTEWISPEGTRRLTCALMTKEAAPSIANIHHRMPVVLHQDQFAAWIDTATDPASVEDMITYCRTDFTGHRVSTRVNSVANDGPELLEPLHIEPGLFP